MGKAFSSETHAILGVSKSIDVWQKEFQTEVEGSPDRSAGILSGAMFDTILGLMIQAKAIDPEVADRRLLRPDRPIGTFKAKIDLCYLFGLIGERDRKALDVVRDIRNEFAHHLENLPFDEQSLGDRARLLAEV